eukprot:TRINITY_DN65923_c0_g1_i6.p2 TRINITY_DN65923_c0_g1~~TRINITY_DN65923_c0_g1_i6.p2  ORF type:complete len:273 (-),score=14.03 TRINITY_DN65923_c0_g1_i6:309-1127(-)
MKVAYPNFRLQYARPYANIRYKNTCMAVSTTPDYKLPPLDDKYEQTVRVSHFANWVMPGRMMLGRYPYFDSVSCTSHEQGEEYLKTILQNGVDTFVCLLDELPPQEDMKMSGVEGFYPYKAPAELIAASMSERPPLDVVEGLRNPVIDQFLPPRKKQPSQEWHPIKLNFVHMPIGPIKEFEPSQITTVLPKIDQLEQYIKQGNILYIHCSGGTGRASVMGACVLIKLLGISVEEALTRTSRGIDSRSGGDEHRIISDWQYSFVNAYLDAMQK